MKRTKLHALNPESARKRIKAAKSNKPFITALMERDHPEHEEAVGQWTTLHEVAFQEPDHKPSPTDHDRIARSSRESLESTPVRGTSRRRLSYGRSRAATHESGSVRRPASAAQKSESGKTRFRKQQVGALRRDAGQMGDQQRLPDPERPLNVDRRAVSELLQRPGESDSDWAKRLLLAAREVQMSVDQLMVVREAILRGIGFYDLGSGTANSDGALTETDWRVLAVLQNLPLGGWERAERMDEARADFERRGTLSFNEVLGPDGGLYHRPSIRGSNPVGDALQTIDGRIRLMQAPPPRDDLLAMLPLIRLTNPSRQGGTPPQGPLAANVAPRVLQFIRSQRGPAAIGLGITLGGAAALQQRDRSEIDQAPDLPPLPGLQPPDEPDNDESFDEASIEVVWVPGLDVPEPDGPKVLIFPDVSEEIWRALIIERREKQETRDQLDVLRDFYTARYSHWEHYRGGRDKDGNELQEFRVGGPGAAFRHPITGKPGDSRPGSIYVDLTFRLPDGSFVHIQTVDVDQDGLPTERELRTARRLANLTGDPVYLVPKIWQLEEIERRSSDFLPIEVR